MKNPLIFAIVTALAITLTSSAALHTWTNKEGKNLEAQLVAVNGDVVQLKTSSGKVYDYQLDQLSATDQAFVKTERENIKKQQEDRQKFSIGSRDSVFQTKLPEALKDAQKHNLPILLVFSGSDWCPPCMRLHDKVITSAALKDFAKENLVIMIADIPKRGNATNQRLLEKYNGGFPSMHVLDSTGKQIGGKWHGYGNQSPDVIIEWIKQCTAKKP